MKLSHVRPTRLLIKYFSVIRQHLYLISMSAVILFISFLGVIGYRYLSHFKVSPQSLLNFFGTPKEQLESTGGLTNFLVLGIRGEGEDSPDLSDTVIVISYNHEKKVASMIGVPRDLWIPSYQAKINTAYHYGEEASPGAGIKFAQGAILEDLGLPIHYTAVVNFSLFKQAVDLVGGVDIDVQPGFVDDEFPIPGRERALPISSRYETIIFPDGLNHMDGQTALKFVRSRHAEGEEGTDFARSNRQQQVLSALSKKIITPSFLLNQQMVDELINIVNSNLISNINANLYPSLAKIALDIKDNPVRSVPLTSSPDENGVAILYHPPTFKYNGEWVLIPKDNNWNALKQYVKNRLSQ